MKPRARGSTGMSKQRQIPIDPDEHVWPPRTFRQRLINLRGLLFGPPLRSSPGSAWFPGGFRALFSSSLPEPHPDSVGWFRRRKLTTLPEFQPTRSNIFEGALRLDGTNHPRAG